MTASLGRRKSDSLTMKLLVAFELATLVLSIYAIASLRSFHKSMEAIGQEKELRIAILAQKLEDSGGCSLDRPKGLMSR